MTPAKLYIWIVSLAFVALAGVILLMPRSEYSELEKRELAELPEMTEEGVKDGSYMKALSAWFSDTEPYRDEFMAASMKVRDAIRYSFSSDEETISFHKGDAESDKEEPKADATTEELEEYENKLTADENAKIGSHGIIIIGSGPNVRALNAFGGAATGGIDFANVVNEYQKEMPQTQVYAMVIPLSSEFYTPDKAKKITRPQQPFIKNIYSHLEHGAKGVPAYNALAEHVKEDIYLRTDHHWAPVGAYYAAQAFAKSAGVPFRDLSAYDKKVIHGYVGSMYGFSNDIAVKNAPEDFVYYTPNAVDYTTTYWVYDVNKNYQVTRERAPYDGKFFAHYADGSAAAYSTFMGGDQKLTRVKTGTKNGRKLIIIKDSYGNALPGYLFYSFEEVYVIDFRYFTRNMKKYVRDNGITDIVFCLNVFNAYSSGASKKISKFLHQGNGSTSSVDAKEERRAESSEKREEKKIDKSTNSESKPETKEERKTDRREERREDRKEEKKETKKDEKSSLPDAKQEKKGDIKTEPVKTVSTTNTDPSLNAGGGMSGNGSGSSSTDSD